MNQTVLSAFTDSTKSVRDQAIAVSNEAVSRPHLFGNGTQAADNTAFEQLLNAKADLRSALAQVEDGIAAVQEWRRS